MKGLLNKSLFSLLFIFFLTQTLFGEEEEIFPTLTIEIPMRDGTCLPTDLYMPDKTSKHLPCILIRTPSGRRQYYQSYAPLVKHGYLVAIQDTRSCIDKEGRTIPCLHDGWGEYKDGYDTVEWLAKSHYTDGNIGTLGFSAMGISQLMLAPSQPPSLKSQYIGFAAGSIFHHGMFLGGQIKKSQVEGWVGIYAKHPLIMQKLSQEGHYNEFWDKFNSLLVAHLVKVPAVHYGGWYDTFIQGTIDSFLARQKEGGEGAKGKQKLIIGPWTHGFPREMAFGDFKYPKAGLVPPIDMTARRWFDFYLKGVPNGVEEAPAVMYYVMGPFDGTPSKGNRWKFSNDWPPPSKELAFYLSDKGHLSETPPLGSRSKSFNYDPRNPTPTIGGHNLFMESGPKDQRPIEERNDVLIFTSDPLKEDLEVTGRIIAKLFVNTNREETDFALRLTDVYPDGKSILITDTIHRYKKDEQSKNQKMGEIELDFWSTSHVFAEGHKIRISITGSNYPRFEKNNNRSFKFLPPLVAKNSVLFGKTTPSRILLPVVREEAL